MSNFQEVFLKGCEDAKQGNEFCYPSNKPEYKEAYRRGYEDGKKKKKFLFFLDK